MTCEKLSVRSCSLMWFLSSVHLTYIAQPELAVSATCAAFNLVIRRPRIVGGTLTIALDSTVKFVKNCTKDTEQHIIRLQYGSKGKRLVMRAANAQDHERWVVAIAAVLPASRNTPACGFKMSKSFRMTKPQSLPHQTTPRESPALWRMLRRNIPAALQLLLTVGQILASAR